MIERQVIVTWYTPEEKMPPECVSVVVTFSGKAKNTTYDKAIGIATWADDDCGWLIDGMPDGAEYTIDAWCDIDPYGWKGEHI